MFAKQTLLFSKFLLPQYYLDQIFLRPIFYYQNILYVRTWIFLDKLYLLLGQHSFYAEIFLHQKFVWINCVWTKILTNTSFGHLLTTCNAAPPVYDHWGKPICFWVLQLIFAKRRCHYFHTEKFGKIFQLDLTPHPDNFLNFLNF